MKRYFLYFFTVLAAGSLGYWFRPARVFAQHVDLVPFSAEYDKTVYNSDGTSSSPGFVHFSFSRRGDGSRSTTVMGGDGSLLVSIIDAARSTYTILDPETLSKITYRYPPERFANAMNLRAEGNCPVSGGPVTLIERANSRFGQSVLHVSAREADAVARDEWVVPALNCFSLETVSPDKSGGRIVTKVTSLTVGPPPTTAFEVPEGYVERSPMSVDLEHKAKVGKEVWGGRTVEIMERNYRILR